MFCKSTSGGQHAARVFETPDLEEDPLPKISVPVVAFADESRGVRGCPVANFRVQSRRKLIQKERPCQKSKENFFNSLNDQCFEDQSSFQMLKLRPAASLSGT